METRKRLQPQPQQQESKLPKKEDKVKQKIIKKIVEDDEGEDNEVVDQTKQDSLSSIFTMKPTALAKLVFPKVVLDKWVRSGTGKHSDGSQRLLKIRDIWELTSPPVQCKNTVLPLTDKHPCWICGEGIPTKVTKKEAGLAAQCEHILPIAQGVMLWSLYNPDDKRKFIEDPDYKKFISSEYDWAHTVCNQVKSSMVLLSLSPDRSVQIDTTKIKSLLSSIFNSTRKDSGPLREILKKKYKKEEDFVNFQLGNMEKKLQPIVSFINAKLKEFGSKLVVLSAYANLLGRIDKELDKIWYETDIQSSEDISNAIYKADPVIVPLNTEDQEVAKDEPFSYVVTPEERRAWTEEDLQGAEILLNLRKSPNSRFGGSRRRKSKKSRSKRRKTYRKLRLF
jgi:hypothetical protein